MPVAVRGLTLEGLQPRVVENVQQMGALDSAVHIAILQGTAGKKNKILMVQEALKKKIHILNLKDPSAFLKKCDEEKAQKKVQIKEQKKSEVKKEEKKEEKIDEKKKSEKNKADASEEKSIDELTKDHKKEEQKQKNKILTKKE